MSNLGQHIEVIGNNAVFLSFTYDNWTWSYRTGAFSTREQKRLLFSPHSDTTATVVYEGTKTYAHLWNYNLVGAGGEELVQYRGIQMAAPNAVDTGRRVYMAPYKYIVPGGEIRILADTNDRELCLTDHLGSVRCIISTNTIVKKDYDYDPFGRYSFPYSPLPEEGFVSEKNDFEEGESNLMQMGVRMYSPQIGRFLAVDPLFEMMPGHNPYHYAFNSPLMWKDPSGLAPEKEKNGEELQFWVKKQTQSSPIDPGEEYWEWIDDKYITYYFSPENDAGFYPGSMLPPNLSMFAMLGVNGGSSSGGGNQGAGPRTQNALPQGNRSNDVIVCSDLGNHDDPNQVSIFMGNLCSVKAPSIWSANNIDNQLEKGGFYNIMSLIQNQINTREIGCFLIYDKITNKISGYFYLGYAYDRWFNFSKYATKAPDNFPVLNPNQMVIGFIHNHLDNSYFSPGDGKAISFFAKGSLLWSNVPQPSDKNDPKILDRMFFGLVHSKGRDGLSFDRMKFKYDLRDLYRNIIGYIYKGDFYDPDFNHIGFDFFNNKGK